MLSDSFRPDASEQASDFGACAVESAACVDDMIGAAAFFMIGQLLGKDLAEFRNSHAGPSQDTATLFPCRRRDDDDSVEAVTALAFEQQGYVERDERA